MEKYKRYPRTAADFATLERFEDMIEQYLLPEFVPSSRFITAASSVRTQGSCFAQHIAAALNNLGVKARHTRIPEAVNSPLTNRLLLEHVLNDAKPYEHPLQEEAWPKSLCRGFREKLPNDDVFILSLGLAYTWFDKASGVPTGLIDARNIGQYEQRLAGVEENVEHTGRIVSMLRTLNPDMRIVLTLSPVPMNVIYNGRTAVVCDLLSKSTLRLAVEEYLGRREVNVFYWPSFEIVRWLGAHSGPVFGAEDDDTRHVNSSIVALIVRLFLKHFRAD